MRVLLVYSNRTRDLILPPPIGLSYVASATRRAGHQVRFLDLLTARDPQAALNDALRDFRPEVVGISVRNIDNVVHQRLRTHLGELARFIGLIRGATGGRVPIVLGGPAISILGALALKHVNADYAVRGEGEITFPALLAALEAGRDPAGIPGVCTRDGAALTDSAPARLPEIGASGMQDWIDWRPYRRHGGTFAIQTKRGCPMPCNYCIYPDIEGRGFRRRAAEDVVDEIEAVQRALAPRTFEFVDSTFNLPEEHAIKICEEILRRRLRINLTTMGINPRGASPELFALMKRAGFNSMMITPEAGNDTMLRNLDKGFDMQDVRRSARHARASGLHSTWFFMLGGPGETRDTVDETLRFVEQELRGPQFMSVFVTGIRMLPGGAPGAGARGTGRGPGAAGVLFLAAGERGVDAAPRQRDHSPPAERRARCRRGRRDRTVAALRTLLAQRGAALLALPAATARLSAAARPAPSSAVRGRHTTNAHHPRRSELKNARDGVFQQTVKWPQSANAVARQVMPGSPCQ